jgi:hypothetical protein
MIELASPLPFWHSPIWLLPKTRSDAAGHELMLDHLLGISTVGSQASTDRSSRRR